MTFRAPLALALAPAVLLLAGCPIYVDGYRDVRVVDSTYGSSYGHSPAKPTPGPAITYGTGKRNPVIQSFTANPGNLVPAGQTITFQVVAYDPNDEVLQYNWSATGGTLSTNTGQVVSWLPPTKAGVYTVSATVANARGGFGMGSLNLTVQADGTTSVGTAPATPAPTSTPTPVPTATPSAEASPVATGKATVAGVVKGPDGALEGADVFLTSTADAGYQAQVKTDAAGAFSFKDAPAGATLVLLASQAGYKAQSRTLAALKAEDELSFTFSLEKQ